MANSVRYVITVDCEVGSVLKVEQLDASGRMIELPSPGRKDLLEQVVRVWLKESPGQQRPPGPTKPERPKSPVEGPEPPMPVKKPKGPKPPQAPKPPIRRDAPAPPGPPGPPKRRR